MHMRRNNKTRLGVATTIYTGYSNINVEIKLRAQQQQICV